MIVHPVLLQVAVATLKSIGISDAEVKQRIIIMARKKDVPREIAAQKWVDIDDLVSGVTPLSGPENYDGEKSHEIAAIYFSSGIFPTSLFHIIPDSPFLIGTTGLSKAVALSHYNICALLLQTGAYWPYYEHGRDVLMGVLPMFHCYGGIILATYAFFGGLPLVILSRFEPDLFLSSIQRFKITVRISLRASLTNVSEVSNHDEQALSLVPPLLNFLCKHPLVAKYDISSVRLILVGAAPVAPASIVQTIELFKKRGVDLILTQGYGLTETCEQKDCCDTQRICC